MPTATAPIDGSTANAQSRGGMAASDFQSTNASRPILAADSWLTTVENVLLISPRQTAANHRRVSPMPSGELSRSFNGSHVLKRISHFFALPGSANFRCWLASTPAGVTFAAADWTLFFN